MNRACWIACLILALACSKSERRLKAAAIVEGLATVPVDARVLVGLNVARLHQSPLLKRAFAQVFAGDDGARHSVEALFTRCKVSPERDLDNILIGAGSSTDATDVVLVAKGRFDAARIVDCVKASLMEKGGKLEEKTVAATEGSFQVFAAESPGVAGKVWMAFAGEGTLILAGDEAWLMKARDPRAAKVKSDPEMMMRLGRTDNSKGIWGVFLLEPELGSAFSRSLGDKAKAPLKAVYGSLDVMGGLSLEANFELGSAEDAKALVELVENQVDGLGLIAHAAGLGAVVSKFQVSSAGEIARGTLKMTAKELEELENQLAMLDNHKEGARDDESHKDAAANGQ